MSEDETWPSLVEDDVAQYMADQALPGEEGVAFTRFRDYTVVAELPEPGQIELGVAAGCALWALRSRQRRSPSSQRLA